jgi:hypothetical protein
VNSLKLKFVKVSNDSEDPELRELYFLLTSPDYLSSYSVLIPEDIETKGNEYIIHKYFFKILSKKYGKSNFIVYLDFKERKDLELKSKIHEIAHLINWLSMDLDENFYLKELLVHPEDLFIHKDIESLPKLIERIYLSGDNDEKT